MREINQIHYSVHSCSLYKTKYTGWFNEHVLCCMVGGNKSPVTFFHSQLLKYSLFAYPRASTQICPVLISFLVAIVFARCPNWDMSTVIQGHSMHFLTPVFPSKSSLLIWNNSFGDSILFPIPNAQSNTRPLMISR